MALSLPFISLFLCLFIGFATAADKPITSMPQWPADYVDYFQLYSGYLNLPDTESKKLHYVFVTSMNDPAKDPVLLWLNGGPGCSSLQGFISEIGPVVLDPNQTEFAGINQYAWNKNASVIFLESPAGVGFSIGNPFKDTYNDRITTQDQYAALLDFFDRFPEFLDNEFWITGESYAGIYGPNLASHILQENVESRVKINLKGIMLGNPLTDMESEERSMIDFLYRRDFLPGQIHRDYESCYTAPDTEKCMKAYETVAELIMNLNIYDVYGICLPDPVLPGQTKPLDSSAPCVDSQAVIDYFNSHEVKKAMGIKSHVVWTACNDTVFQRYQRQESTVDKYKIFKKAGLRVLIYSGDVDAVVPTLDTEKWINRLKFDVVDSWRVWSITPDQIAGYVVAYDGLTFATVRGAGHMVPTDKREEAYNMFVRFVNGLPL